MFVFFCWQIKKHKQNIMHNTNRLNLWNLNFVWNFRWIEISMSQKTPDTVGMIPMDYINDPKFNQLVVGNRIYAENGHLKVKFLSNCIDLYSYSTEKTSFWTKIDVIHWVPNMTLSWWQIDTWLFWQWFLMWLFSSLPHQIC